jgi:kynurenine 3-monooxygenase
VITIVGAGPAGCLLALLLARRGERVRLLERRPDPRHAPPERGRSINLALAARGIRALDAAGVVPLLAPLMVRMRGRMVHDLDHAPQFAAYGQRAEEVIWSVSRSALTAALTDAARDLPGVELSFGQQCLDYTERGTLQMRDLGRGEVYELETERIIGADGAGSVLRNALARNLGFDVAEEPLGHDYKELNIPAATAQLHGDALHIWPRGGFMLIALPNADGSFTATLFLPRTAHAPRKQWGFDTLTDGPAVTDFFARQFPDAVALIPDLAGQFANHPQGQLGTVYCPQWHDEERLLLVGDAAHAIVPFHGQGMNCAFEDCRILNDLLIANPDDAFQRFFLQRRDDCLAIAEMALENYAEMRSSVRDPRYLQQRELALALERAYPARFVPRYAMVMFRHEIPYATALQRGRVQQQILDELLDASCPANSSQAQQKITTRLTPLVAAAG